MIFVVVFVLGRHGTNIWNNLATYRFQYESWPLQASFVAKKDTSHESSLSLLTVQGFLQALNFVHTQSWNGASAPDAVQWNEILVHTMATILRMSSQSIPPPSNPGISQQTQQPFVDVPAIQRAYNGMTGHDQLQMEFLTGLHCGPPFESGGGGPGM